MAAKGHQRVGSVIYPACAFSAADGVAGCSSAQPLVWMSQAVVSIMLEHLGETWTVQSVTRKLIQMPFVLQIFPNI